MAYTDALGNVIGLDMPTPTYSTGSGPAVDDFSDIFGESDLERSAELKKKELFRKGKLEYEDNGELIHDSNAMIRTKEAANAGIRGVDWLLEASENIADFGQGDLLDHTNQFRAENQGKTYALHDRDFIAARALGDNATGQLKEQYQNAVHDENADKGIYTLRKFDGYNLDGTTKYIYKYGLAEVGADARYRDQYVQDGFEIVEEKRFAGAEDWEKTWNASQGVLDARTLDSTRVDIDGKMTSRNEASGINFGAGYTELVNEDLLGTDVGKTQEDYDKNKIYSERLSKASDAKWQSGMSDSVVDAIQSGAAKTVVDTADFILDVLTPFGDNTLLNNVKKQESIDKWVGYDRTQSTQALSDAATFWNQGEYLDAIKMVVTDPNTMAESIPMMIGMVAGSGKFTAVSKVVSQIQKAKKAGDLAKATSLEKKLKLSFATQGAKGAKAEKIYNKLKDAPAQLKAYDHFAKNAGFHTIVGAMTNNVLDDRIAEKEANGEPGSVDMGEVLGVYALQLPLLAIDRLSFKAILGLGKEGKALKTAFGSLDDAGKKTVLVALAKKAGEMTAAGAGEGVQEYMQTWGEILGAKAFVGGDSISDVYGDEGNQREALMGGLGGLGAGVQMHGLGHALPDAARAGKKAYDYSQQSDSEKVIRKARSLNDIKIGENVNSSDIIDKIAAEVSSENKSTLSDFDIKDTKSFTRAIEIALDHRFKNAKSTLARDELRKNFVKRAMTKIIDGAKKSYMITGDKKSFDDQLAFITKVHQDANIDFSLGDIQQTESQKFADRFLDLVNKTYKNSSAGSSTANSTTAQQQAKEEIDELLAELDGEQVIQTLYTQGSTINLGENDTLTVDDDALRANSELNLPDLKKLIVDYRDGKKDFKSVSDEIAKFGLISESGDGTIKTKASMSKYDEQLTEQFKNVGSLIKALDPTSTTYNGGKFANFIGWAKSRLEKTLPKIHKNGSVAASWDSNNVHDLSRENSWFHKKVETLQALLDSHEIGEDKLTQKEYDAIQEKLIETKSNLVKADANLELHKKKIEEYVRDVLGLDPKGIQWDNKEMVKQLSGARTKYDVDSEGNLKFGPMKVYQFGDKSHIESQQFARNKLMNKWGMENNGKFTGQFSGDFEYIVKDENGVERVIESGSTRRKKRPKKEKPQTQTVESESPTYAEEQNVSLDYQEPGIKQTKPKQAKKPTDSEIAEKEHREAQELLKKTKYGIVEDMTETEFLANLDEAVNKAKESKDPVTRKKWRQVYSALTKNQIYARNEINSVYYNDIRRIAIEKQEKEKKERKNKLPKKVYQKSEKLNDYAETKGRVKGYKEWSNENQTYLKEKTEKEKLIAFGKDYILSLAGASFKVLSKATKLMEENEKINVRLGRIAQKISGKKDPSKAIQNLWNDTLRSLDKNFEKIDAFRDELLEAKKSKPKDQKKESTPKEPEPTETQEEATTEHEVVFDSGSVDFGEDQEAIDGFQVDEETTDPKNMTAEEYELNAKNSIMDDMKKIEDC